MSKSLITNLKHLLGKGQACDMFDENFMLSSLPLMLDGIVIGYLVITEPYNSVNDILSGISASALIAVLVTIAILAPISWYWGKRIVTPLLNLESCILKIGKEPLDSIYCLAPNNTDEIGRLSQHFQKMLTDLKQKDEMEKQIIRSERLAAIGTLAAGVAHEINNPLTGMIMALDTYKRFCLASECRQQYNAVNSIELVERGLKQIRNTLSTLLFNLKADDSPLARVDIEDAVKLVMPRMREKAIEIYLDNQIRENINLPSSSVRQVVINLLLNAVSAAQHKGRVDCRVSTEDGNLLLEIGNDGKMISGDQMEHLFEPYYSSKSAGAGLGLWITFQIVHSLQGDIKVMSEDGWTAFTVVVPMYNEDKTL